MNSRHGPKWFRGVVTEKLRINVNNVHVFELDSVWCRHANQIRSTNICESNVLPIDDVESNVLPIVDVEMDVSVICVMILYSTIRDGGASESAARML